MKTKGFHFFASSIAEWRTDTDLTKLISFMQQEQFDFAVYYVPLHEELNYEIRAYIPAVEGIEFLGVYNNTGRVE